MPVAGGRGNLGRWTPDPPGRYTPGMRKHLTIRLGASLVIGGLPLVVGASSALGQGTREPGIEARVDRMVERYRVSRKVPGIAVAVVRNGSVAMAKGYGFSNLELEARVTPKTLFGLGSISKQFVATAIMQLVEDGKVRLDDPVTRYVDSLPPHWERITIRHLLTHTSGIPEEHWLPSFVEFDRFEHRHLDVLRTIFADSLESPPGTAWAYRNSGYRLLGMVIEKASGQSLWTVLDRRIFRPVGMAATRSSDPQTIIANRAKGYGRERGRIVNRDPVTESAAFSEGALMSSVLDLARWDSSLYRPRILTQSSLDQMWTPVSLGGGKTYPYGFGWGLAPTNGLRTVSHGGGLPGFVTNISRFVAKGLTVIVLTNAEWADPTALTGAIAGLYEAALAPKPEPAIEDGDPAFTAAIRRVVEGLGRGELDSSRLAPAAREGWPAETVRETAALVGRLGPVRGLELIERLELGDFVRRRYRASMARGALALTVLGNRAGLILTLDLAEPIAGR